MGRVIDRLEDHLESDKGIVYEICQMIGKRKLGVSFKKSLIEVLVSFDVEDEYGRPTEKRLCIGVVGL